MRLTICNFFLLFLTVWATQEGLTQTPNGNRPDTTRRPGLPASSTSPKPYKDVITSKAISDGGLFWVHKVEEKYYFEIPDSLFGREILVVNRISKASAGMSFRQFFFVMVAIR
ncbi:MAG: DUF5118 domain-containing protein [Chitinophagaceae bacterium]|nr:DUF5118 domain-containing protein [Chitinophagaceae bacterium]